jgi:hypothetical protein
MMVNRQLAGLKVGRRTGDLLHMRPFRNSPIGRCRGRSACPLGALLVALLLLPLAAEVLAAQQAARRDKPQRRARDVHLLIDTERTTYRVGDSIRVRVSFVNTADHRIGFFPQGTHYDTELIVWGADGRVVKPTGQKAPPIATSGAPAMLLPHQTVPWGWADAEWLYLSDWGYQLRAPGRYTIRGLPRLGFPELEPDNKTVRSNTVTITLTP